MRVQNLAYFFRFEACITKVATFHHFQKNYVHINFKPRMMTGYGDMMESTFIDAQSMRALHAYVSIASLWKWGYGIPQVLICFETKEHFIFKWANIREGPNFFCHTRWTARLYESQQTANSTKNCFHSTQCLAIPLTYFEIL